MDTLTVGETIGQLARLVENFPEGKDTPLVIWVRDVDAGALTVGAVNTVQAGVIGIRQVAMLTLDGHIPQK